MPTDQHPGGPPPPAGPHPPACPPPPVQIRAASLLGLPIVVTEQYAKALGPTVPELLEALPPGAATFAKTQFGMVTPEVEALLHQLRG